MIYTVNGVPLQLGASGGATDADIRFCLDRMACIVRLSLQTARAEFPDYTILYSMSVFALESADIAEERHVQGSFIKSGGADWDKKMATFAKCIGEKVIHRPIL